MIPRRGLLVPLLAGFVLAGLAGCGRGPTEADLAGCTVRHDGPPISLREVADCERDRAELGQR
ncbi:hypothetical protein [Bradyrhizobium sp. USDA 4545]|uniref:hypothetical protein n=1 Tax=Bradyrhizobium sp. USDA 4545 TaxID=2817705 RepID=UPI0020A24B26|nr:hypothetical protein [Bradyrhizobium sp. USDA 4545]MCP1832855.1 hypothetical protein [Bradyrhizobium sp. USDA 4545]